MRSELEAVSDPAYQHIAAINGYLQASFTLLRTEEGGRKSPIGRDYRPNWSIGEPSPEAQAGAALTTDEVESVAPGERHHLLGVSVRLE